MITLDIACRRCMHTQTCALVGWFVSLTLKFTQTPDLSSHSNYSRLPVVKGSVEVSLRGKHICFCSKCQNNVYMFDTNVYINASSERE